MQITMLRNTFWAGQLLSAPEGRKKAIIYEVSEVAGRTLIAMGKAVLIKPAAPEADGLEALVAEEDEG